MKSMLIKFAIALLGGAIVLVAGSMKSYPENAKMAALLVFVLGVFMATVDEKLMQKESPAHKKQQ